MGGTVGGLVEKFHCIACKKEESTAKWRIKITGRGASQFLLFTKHYYSYQIKETETGGSCSTYGRNVK
jgi:hypothetical protein